jgi:hypothetical protein
MTAVGSSSRRMVSDTTRSGCPPSCSPTGPLSSDVAVAVGPTRSGVTAGLDGDNFGGDRPDRQSSPDPGDHVLSAMGSVQQQDVVRWRVPSASPLTRRWRIGSIVQGVPHMVVQCGQARWGGVRG